MARKAHFIYPLRDVLQAKKSVNQTGKENNQPTETEEENMLIIKLTRTQVLQQENRKKEEKAADKKKMSSLSPKRKSQIKPTTKTIVCSNENEGPSKVTKSMKKQITKPLKGTTNPKTKPAHKTIAKSKVLQDGRKEKVKSYKSNTKPKTKTARKILTKKKPMGTKKSSKATPKSFKVVSKVGSKASVKLDTKQDARGEIGPDSVRVVAPDCSCSEGGREQSCWMCRLAQRLGGKNIATTRKGE